MTTLSPGTQHAKVTVKLSVLGEMQLDRAIQGRIKATSDLSPAFEKIADDFIEMQEKAFAAEGAYEGNPAWAPLSAKYAAWKAKKFPGRGILERSGALKASLTGGAGSSREIEPLKLSIGGSVRVGRWDLGAIHQKPKATNKLPKRELINLSMTRRRRWMRWIVDMFRGEER